jgi:hypothetical protein
MDKINTNQHFITKKDVSIIYLYGRYIYGWGKYLNQSKKNKELIKIVLNKNKKIDPQIIYDINAKYYLTEHPSLYRGNVCSKFMRPIHKCKHNRSINHWTEYQGITLDIKGSRNSYYDYSLDDLPLDLPITYLILNNLKFMPNINKLPDSIKFMDIQLQKQTLLNYLPKSLEILICQGVNLDNLPIEHNNNLTLVILGNTSGLDSLPTYIKNIYIETFNITLCNLPINLEYLEIAIDTILVDIPLSITKLVIPKNYKYIDNIKQRLQNECRAHILYT